MDSSSIPWICPQSQGGAIDPAGYTDTQGRRWVTYKVDGNAVSEPAETLCQLTTTKLTWAP